MTAVDGITVVTDVAEACEKLSHDDLIGFDTETTGLIPQLNNIAVVQLYGDNTGTLAVVQIRDGVIPENLKGLLSTNGKTIIGHNVVNFDLAFLKTHGVDWPRATWYDTLVAETVLASTGRKDVSVSLRESVRRRLGLKIDKTIAHGAWAADSLSADQIDYAARDVISLPALYRSQLEKAEETGQLEAMKMEQELMPYVSMMYSTGLPLKKEVLMDYMDAKIVEAEALEIQLYARLGKINLNSTQQLMAAIYKTTGVQLSSTADEMLVDALTKKICEPAWPVIELIRTYRKPKQLMKMYTEEWADRYIIADRVHSRFWQCSADTSRFTSSGPNLQQWPKVMREVIGNVDGWTVVAGDYSQIEVRIAAVMANDGRLIQVLLEEDVHTAIASEVYKLPLDRISSQQRKNAKALTFALLYDGTPNTLYRHSKTSGGSLTYNECVGLERVFFETFTGLREARAKAHRLAARPGPAIIRLPNGLRRILAGRNKRASTILNTMVQGSAAIGIKYGILEAGRRGLVDGYMGAQVHDELVCAVPDNMAEEYAKELEESMILGMSKVLPGIVKVETKTGKHWRT